MITDKSTGVLSFILLLMMFTSASSQQPEPDTRSALLERGRYLVQVAAACGFCHNTRGSGGQFTPGMELAGGLVIQERGYRAVVPNITPDPETGIGRWSDAQIAMAICNGQRPDGSLIGPPMPLDAYRGISDHDLASMVAYLRTASPVRHTTERSAYPTAVVRRDALVTSVPDPADNPVARGAYLAGNLAHCMNCHSARLADGRKDPERPGASGATFVGPWGTAIARNISSHPELGVGLWTDAQLIGAITHGVSPDGRPLVRPMGGRAPVWAQLTNADQRDLLAYIRSLPPQAP